MILTAVIEVLSNRKQQHSQQIKLPLQLQHFLLHIQRVVMVHLFQALPSGQHLVLQPLVVLLKPLALLLVGQYITLVCQDLQFDTIFPSSTHA